jgi:hypothetical protein
MTGILVSDMSFADMWACPHVGISTHQVRTPPSAKELGIKEKEIESKA